MYLLTALILVNVVTRYSHFPIYWIDESAVYCVVWLTFIGASAMTRLRLDFAVTMMTERLSARGQKIAKITATGGDRQQDRDRHDQTGDAVDDGTDDEQDHVADQHEARVAAGGSARCCRTRRLKSKP
jgi:hypothetical protein